MRENIAVLTTKTIQIGLVILAFLVPIFFLPTTSEFYNFNKVTLLVVAAFFLFFVWGVKMVAEQRVKMTRTPLDMPLLIFLGVYTLATIFSIDPVTSFLGWHPVFFGSLPSIAALIIIYLLATSHLDSTYRKAVFIAFSASATLLAISSIAYYLGHPLLSADWAQARQWTAAGDLNKLVAFLSISVLVTVSLALLIKDGIPRYIVFVLAALQIIAFALINSLFAYIVLAVAVLIVLLFLPRLAFSRGEKLVFGALGVLLLLIVVLVNVSGLGNSVLKPLISGEDKSVSITKPIRLPFSAAWQSTAQSLANRPLFGSGPSTFGLIFPSFKPVSLNQVNENNLWNIRFDESGSGALNILATTGAVGGLAFLLVIVLLIRSIFSFSAKGEATRGRNEFIFLQASLVAALISWIVFDISAVNGLAFILLAAIFFSTIRDWGSNLAGEVTIELVALRSGAIRAVEGVAKAPNSLAWVFFVPGVILFAAIVFYSWSTYAAEFYYQKAIVSSQENQGKDTRDNLVAAIKANQYRDTYHRALLVTDLALARSLNQLGDKLTEDQQNTLLALVREAIDQGRIITGYEGRGLGSFQIKRVPGTASFNVANWESVATVYANIGGQLRNDAAVHAINTYSQAVRLDPTNPRLYEALGNVYFNLGDLDNAIKNYDLAVSVKPDYASAHYNLAQSLRRKGENPARVVTELQATLQLLEDTKQNKENRARIQKELDEAKKKLEEAQKNQQQQQLQQLQPPATPSAIPGQ